MCFWSVFLFSMDNLVSIMFSLCLIICIPNKDLASPKFFMGNLDFNLSLAQFNNSEWPINTLSSTYKPMIRPSSGALVLKQTGFIKNILSTYNKAECNPTLTPMEPHLQLRLPWVDETFIKFYANLSFPTTIQIILQQAQQVCTTLFLFPFMLFSVFKNWTTFIKSRKLAPARKK